MKFFAAITLAALPMCSLAMSGNELYGKINSSDPFQTIQAAYYIDGVLDQDNLFQTYEVILQQRAGTKDQPFLAPHICTPEGATNGQIGDVVKKYLAQNPETRNLDSIILVNKALLDAFPCARNADQVRKPRSGQ